MQIKKITKKILTLKILNANIVAEQKVLRIFLWANPEDLSAQEHNMALRIY